LRSRSTRARGSSSGSRRRSADRRGGHGQPLCRAPGGRVVTSISSRGRFESLASRALAGGAVRSSSTLLSTADTTRSSATSGGRTSSPASSVCPGGRKKRFSCELSATGLPRRVSTGSGAALKPCCYGPSPSPPLSSSPPDGMDGRVLRKVRTSFCAFRHLFSAEASTSAPPNEGTEPPASGRYSVQWTLPSVRTS
jgi:hypothetical protein